MGQDMSAMTVVARLSGHLDVFWVGTDGHVWSQWWDQAPGMGWADHDPFPIARTFPVPVAAGTAVKAVARRPGHLDVFWAGTDGRVWSQWWDDGETWNRHGAFPIARSFPVAAQSNSAVAAVARQPGHLDVFWIGSDGHVWSQWWDEGPGMGWANHDPFPIARNFLVPVLGNSTIAAVARLPGHLDLFWLGTDGRVWSQWWDEGPGMGWANHDPFPIARNFSAPVLANSSIAAVARLPGHLDVFWLGTDGGIWSQWWDQTAGMSWADHDPFPIAHSFPVPAQANSPVGAVARLSGHLDVFWIGTDGRIWSQWWDQAPGMGWGDHDPFPIARSLPVPAAAGTGVDAVSRLPGHLDVFWAGTDANVWSQWWDQAAGMSWADHDPFIVTGPVVPPPLPETVTFGPTTVTFADGTALGGNFTLVINKQGDWTFSGHLHDSGFDSYDYTLAIVVMTPSGIGYTLSRSGHTEGTSANPFGPDRDDDWISSGNNPSLRDQWPQVQEAASGWRIVAQDLLGQALSDQIQKAAEEALKELAKKGIEAGIAALIALL